MNLLRLGFVGLLILACCACSGDKESDEPASTEPEVQRTTIGDDFWAGFEPGLRSLIESQPWFERTIPPDGFRTLKAVRRSATTATFTGHGQDAVVRIIEAVSTQPWYGDGLDGHEHWQLASVLNASADLALKYPDRNLTDEFVSALTNNRLRRVELPESGERTLIAFTRNDTEARNLLNLTARLLPEVEKVVGPYPYGYLVLHLTDKLPSNVAGQADDGIVYLRLIDAPTLAHELTHVTMGGRFDFQFREGLAHFMQGYLLSDLDRAYAQALADLQQAGWDRTTSRPSIAASGPLERASGLVWLKDIYDQAGIETISRWTRILRDRFRNVGQVYDEVPRQASTTRQQQALIAYVCPLIPRSVGNDVLKVCRKPWQPAERDLLDKGAAIDSLRRSMLAHGFELNSEKGARGLFVEAVGKAYRNAFLPGITADPQTVVDALWESGWVGDGFEEDEIATATLIFQAYADALSRFQDEDPSPFFVATLKSQQFAWVALPETGKRLVIVSALNPVEGEQALGRTVQLLPEVEGIAGPYTWSYVSIRVTTDVSPIQVCDGNAEAPFLWIRPDLLETNALPRELARAASTLTSDAWIREGLLEVAAAYASGRVREVRAEHESVLAAAGTSSRVNASYKGLCYDPTDVERAQYTLFMLDVTDVIGINGISRLIRRTRADWAYAGIGEFEKQLRAQVPPGAQLDALDRVFCQNSLRPECRDQ